MDISGLELIVNNWTKPNGEVWWTGGLNCTTSIINHGYTNAVNPFSWDATTHTHTVRQNRRET